MPTDSAHPQCVSAGEHVCQHPSGRGCVETGCDKPAGTWWGPNWCPEHDKERLDRVTGQFLALFDTPERSPR